MAFRISLEAIGAVRCHAPRLAQLRRVVHESMHSGRAFVRIGKRSCIFSFIATASLKGSRTIVPLIFISRKAGRRQLQRHRYLLSKLLPNLVIKLGTWPAAGFVDRQLS